MSEESPLNIFDPVYFDAALLDNPPPPPRHRRAKRMPGTLLPVLLKTGDFWVPDVWRLRANATEAVNACRVRRSIVRDVPPIDFEALVELGEFIGLDADSGREFHVQMAAPNFVYAPKVVIFRESDGGLMIGMAVPGGTLIVPRRAPRESAGAPDLRDDFEVVCVFDHEGLFYAAPLAACWRFALAWGPNVPLAAELSLALQARDASFLTPPKAPHFRRLEVEVTFRLDAEHAQRFIDDLYVQARSGAFVVVGGSGPPQAIVQIRPMDKTRWIAELAFDYDGLVVPPADSPHSEDSVGRERHLVRDFMAEDLALETLTGLLGEPDEFGCVWVIARRRVQALRETLAAIQQEHGWRVEVADEPIASLDPSNSLAIMKLLRPLAAATPVVGVFHQPEMTARFCTRVIAIKHGRIIYDGAPELSHAELEEIYGNELMEVLRPAPVMPAPAPFPEAAHSAGLELAKLA